MFPQPAVPWGSPAPSELCPRCLPQGQGEEGRERRGGQSQQPFHLGGHGGHGPQWQVRTCCHRLSEEICWLGEQVSPCCVRRLQTRCDGELLLPACANSCSHCGLHVVPIVCITRASQEDGWNLSLRKGELLFTADLPQRSAWPRGTCKDRSSMQAGFISSLSVWASLLRWPVLRVLQQRLYVSLGTHGVRSPFAM